APGCGAPRARRAALTIRRFLPSPPAPSRGVSGAEGVELLEDIGDQGRDLRTLRACEGDVGEEIVALELLDDRGDAVMAADAQVVSLSDVMSEHDLRIHTDAREHRQQHIALQ